MSFEGHRCTTAGGMQREPAGFPCQDGASANCKICTRTILRNALCIADLTELAFRRLGG